MTNFKKIILPRSFKINYNLLNKIVYVHNGKELVEILILKDMIGFKIGEFSSTRQKVVHKKIK